MMYSNGVYCCECVFNGGFGYFKFCDEVFH